METTETAAPGSSPISTRSVGIKYGLYFGLLAIVMFVIFSLSGISQTEGWAKWISYPLPLIAVFLAHQHFKEKGDSYLSFGEGVTIAFWLGAVTSLLSSVFMFIYIKFIDASFLDIIREKQIEAMEAKNMSQEQIDQAMSIASTFTSPTALLIFGIVFGIIFYIISGLIVSIFTQKKNPNPTYL